MKTTAAVLVSVLLCGGAPAPGAAEIDLDAPYSSERPGGFKGEKQLLEIEFSPDKGQKECKGDGCNISGSTGPGSDIGKPIVTEPGVEQSPTGPGVGVAIFGPALGKLNGLISRAIGGGSAAASLQEFRAKFAAYGEWVKNGYPTAENTIHREMQKLWSNGYFYSEDQHTTTINELKGLVDTISKGDLKSDDIVSVVIHVRLSNRKLRRQ